MLRYESSEYSSYYGTYSIQKTMKDIIFDYVESNETIYNECSELIDALRIIDKEYFIDKQKVSTHIEVHNDKISDYVTKKDFLVNNRYFVPAKRK